jgi:hypothetical protein
VVVGAAKRIDGKVVEEPTIDPGHCATGMVLKRSGAARAPEFDIGRVGVSGDGVEEEGD